MSASVAVEREVEVDAFRYEVRDRHRGARERGRVRVGVHLQGHTTLEIARQTHHNPKSVDAYLKTFDAVLILHLYRTPPQLAATILGHGLNLIDEYHHIMRSYLKDPETMRDHLTARGVKLPAQALHTG